MLWNWCIQTVKTTLKCCVLKKSSIRATNPLFICLNQSWLFLSYNGSCSRGFCYFVACNSSQQGGINTGTRQQHQIVSATSCQDTWCCSRLPYNHDVKWHAERTQIGIALLFCYYYWHIQNHSFAFAMYCKTALETIINAGSLTINGATTCGQSYAYFWWCVTINNLITK